MGAKTSFLAIYTRDPRDVLRSPPPLDSEAAKRFAQVLTGRKLESADNGTLGEGTNPPAGVLFAASYPGLDILCDGTLALDRPSQLPTRYTRVTGRVVLHAMHSVVDWFAFGVWDGGALVRALSVSPDQGIIEDIGPKMDFEVPYWAGEYPVNDEEEQDVALAEEDAYPLPFHPLELGEEALNAFFGFRLEGMPTAIEPFEIPLAGFRVARQRSLVDRVRGWMSGRDS